MRHPWKQASKRATLQTKIENIQMIRFFITIHIHSKQSFNKPVSN